MPENIAFGKIPSAVIQCGVLAKINRQPYMLTIYLCIASHIDGDTWRAFPSVRIIAAQTGISERHIRRLIPKLEQVGLLSVTRGGGRGWANEYELVTDPEKLGHIEMSSITADERVTDLSTIGDISGLKSDKNTSKPGHIEMSAHQQSAEQQDQQSSAPDDEDLSEWVKAQKALTRLGVKRAAFASLPRSLTANAVIRHWLTIDHEKANSPPAVLVAALKKNSQPDTQPTPKQIALWWNKAHVAAIIMHDRRIENTGERARYNGDWVNVPGIRRILIKEIPSMIFE